MNKRLLMTAAAVTLSLGAAVPLVASASQAGNGAGSTSLVDNIATKFSLNKADVQKVFDENRTEHQAERTQEAKDRTTTLVNNGKITQAQADTIQAKQTEMQTFVQTLKDKTRTERQAAMSAKHDEIVQWAKDNGIDQSFLMIGRGGNMHSDGHHGMMHDSDAN